MKLIEDCFQNEKGEWDLSRILWAIVVVTFLLAASWHFSTAQDFGIGAGAVLGGGGIGAWMHGKAP